ncbi:MATE family efflux transporter [Sedimentibacter sp.]|uniref:MATE family efflux transporter n=1 Tax=Sedimentibacter sp. TaxID=1960295 RepID=UPI0028AD5AF8|nr:MATE family efflux transporter [Sedimentibacter sp.]
MELIKKEHDLTEGVIWKKLVIFFMPILLGSLFQQLYTTADAVILGRFAGVDALASIDAIYSLTKLPVNFFVGLSSGATIIVSQYFGAKNYEDLSKTVHTAIAFAISGGLVLSIMGIVLAPYFLKLMQVPDDIFNYSLSYARIFFAGMAASMVYNVGTGILRAVGNSKSTFYFLIVANIVNVVLDLLFVGLFRWHVAGAAFSTVIAQILSASLVIIALIKTALPCKIIPKKIRFHKAVLKSIFRLGLPIGVQSSLYPLANMLIQSNINQFGTNSIAAWALCGKLDLLIWLIIDSFGITISTFTAQNYGARNYSRIRKGVNICMGISLTLIFTVSGALYVWCRDLSFLFISDVEVIELTAILMKFLSPLYFLYIGGEVFSGAIRGTGETFKPMVLTLIGTCACRVLWILLAVPLNPTIIMVLWSYPVSWLITSVMFIVYYQIYYHSRLADNLSS